LTWRHVKDGETLGSIADEYGVRWLDLALYNWHTINPGEINWYLYYFMGCRKHNGKWYRFSSADQPGMLLVPDVPKSVKKGPLKVVSGVRGGRASRDTTKLQVAVYERLATGSLRELSGKWLYVFSGSGVDFGYEPPPPPPIKIQGEVKHSPLDQPGSAFTLHFPGIFHVRAKPDRLDYEILVTSKDPPSSGLIQAVSGKDPGKTQLQYKTGRHWHFISDPKILAKATQAKRHTRDTHAYRVTKTVTIDLAPKGQPRRFYFLLSPVQLGPEAIKYAMNNPKGLTPLMKPDLNTVQWDPNSPTGPRFDQYMGPQPKDVKNGYFSLGVIDPFAWAETLAQEIYGDSIKQYNKWINSGKDFTIKALEKKTKWTPDHYYVAQLLKGLKDSHPKPDKIEGEIKNPQSWYKNLKEWEQKLTRRNAEISASAHRSLLAILEYLDGPGHEIIETALMKDATDGNPQDVMDVAWGIVHWAACTEHLMALEPGVVYLKELLAKKDTLVYQAVLKHFKDLEKANLSVTLSKTEVKVLRYAYNPLLQLLGLKEFVSDAPTFRGSHQDYLRQLANYMKQRRDNIITILNAHKILPYRVKGSQFYPQGGLWSGGSVAFLSILDLADKWTTYILDEDISIPRKNKFLNFLANIEERFSEGGAWEKYKWVNQGTSYGLKIAALGISGYNLITTITTARYDYQRSVTALDWFGTASGAIIAVQDALAEVAVLVGNAGMKRVFPQLITSAGGPSWGVGAARITGVAGWTFAGLNVVAMFVSGVVTMVAMHKGYVKAQSRGDYTAAAFYGVGFVGGAAMAGGAIVLGVVLVKTGAGVSATGVGATVGIILIAVGGIIAGLAALFAWLFSSDDFQVFARKCFLGKEGHLEPRWQYSGGLIPKTLPADPPEWSHAAKQYTNSWPIQKQKRAILNLLGRFKLKTKPLKKFERTQVNKPYAGNIQFSVEPGLLMPGSTFEVALHIGEKGTQTSATVRPIDDKPVQVKKGWLFHASKTSATYTMDAKGHLTTIILFAKNLSYDGNKGSLICTMTLRFPDLPNTIRCRKLVMEHGAIYGVTVDDDEEVSEIYL
jgi:hypothetical protein